MNGLFHRPGGFHHAQNAKQTVILLVTEICTLVRELCNFLIDEFLIQKLLGRYGLLKINEDCRRASGHYGMYNLEAFEGLLMIVGRSGTREFCTLKDFLNIDSM